ncbi:peptidylprolyl isomerase [Cereibacter sp. SYSU M97828]|nr:peptidylprolyl isomerase [Cereibacter flavus]
MTRLTLAFALAAALATPVAAQNLFAPRVIVNDHAVTGWEMQQRVRFLELLRAPGDIQKTAYDGLIDDRLRLDAASRLGIEATDEQIRGGMEEFAQRANLPAEEFIRQIGTAGVEEETFRDFVKAGIVWREVVRQRYLQRVTITNAEVDRAIENMTTSANIRVLLSELILAAPPGQEGQALDFAEDLAAGISSEAEFSAAAQQYSAAPSAQNGGRIEWLSLNDLPPALRPTFLALRPGQVTSPLPIPNGVALFQLRQLQEGAPSQSATEVEIAQYALGADENPGEVKARVDSCADLYTVARGKSEQALQFQTLPTANLPEDLALAVSQMDLGESAVMNRGGTPTFVMLCARRPVSEEPVNRNAVRDQLQNQRLGQLAEVYLDELRDNAIIRQP